MKVLFLNPPFIGRFSRAQRSPAVTKSGTLYYPIWLAYATGVLEQAGFTTKLIDAPARKLSTKATLELTREFNPKLIVIDTSTPSIYNDVRMTTKLKAQMPESFITLVGTHVSALPDEVLRLSQEIDALARGEYDYTIRELAVTLAGQGNLEQVLGLSFRKKNLIIHNPDRPKITDLDQLPFVSQVYNRHLNIKDYFFAACDYPEVQIFTGRGCPFRCFFCVYPQLMHGSSYRARSPENVVEEFKFIAANLPSVKEIEIDDDTFTIDIKRVERICDLLIKEKLNLKWTANARADLGLNIMQKMKQAGCRLLTVGFESASQMILNNIDKGITLEQIEEFFANSKRAKLLVHAAFMLGNPSETEATIKQTLALAKRLMPDTVQFFPLMVYPGTKAFSWASQNNFLRTTNYRNWVTQEGLHNCVLNLPNLPAQVIVAWCDKGRRQYYLNFRYLFYKLRQMLVHPEEIIRTIKAFWRFKKFLLQANHIKKKFHG